MKKIRKMTAVLLAVVMIVLMIPVGVVSVSATHSTIEAALSWALDIANDDRHGYVLGASHGSEGMNYDCSSFVSWALIHAGIDVPVSTTFYMKENFEPYGFEWIDWSNIGGTNNLQRGDILLDIDTHVEFYYGNNQIIGAHRPATGISVSSYYNNVNGVSWDGVLRYKDEPDYPPTNVWLESSQEWYDINDTVKLIAHADNAQYFWITVHKDGQHLLTQKCDGELSFSSNQYGSGDYYAWITAYNSAGEKDSDGITFSVGGNPQYSTIYTSRAWYELTDTVSITVHTQKAKGQCLGIDKEGVGRIFTSDTDNTFNCSAMDLGVGQYSAYFTVYNDSGYIDTNRVEFSITDSVANYTDFHITKSCYNINETIEFSVTTKFSKRQIIGIDKVGQGRVLTKETDTTYYLSASELGVGEYTAYYSVYNDKGYTDTQLESFEIIDVKPSYTNVYVSKSENLLSDIIQISVNPLYADKLVIGIDKEGVGRIITEDTSDYYNISANKLGIGNYSAYFTLLNQKGYTDTHLITFSIVEQYSSVDLGDSFTALIKNTNNNKPIENSNENVVLSYEKHALNQLWHFKRNEDGTYTIISLFDNKALEVYNAGHENGCNIQVYDRNDSNAQKWYILENGNGYNLIAKCAPSKTMDLKGNSPDDQTNIHIWECHGRDAQIFSVDPISDISIYLYGAKLGDTNLDGKINVRDVTAIQRHLADLETFTEEQLAVADTNGDGIVNIDDATYLQTYLAEYNVVLGKQS